MTTKPIIIWTRSRENWREDESLFYHANNAHVLHIPCLAHEFLKFQAPKEDFDAFLFTSSRAVEALKINLDEFANIQWQLKRAFCHGPATAAAATALGLQTKAFTEIQSSIELPAHLAKEKLNSLLWIRTETPANDLKKHFSQLSLKLFECVGYQTKSKLDLDDEQLSRIVEILNNNKKNITVCFASPSAAIGFQKLFAKIDSSVIPHLRPVVIGKTTREATEKVFSEACKKMGLTFDSKVQQARDATIESLVNYATSHK